MTQITIAGCIDRDHKALWSCLWFVMRNTVQGALHLKQFANSPANGTVVTNRIRYQILVQCFFLQMIVRCLQLRDQQWPSDQRTGENSHGQGCNTSILLLSLALQNYGNLPN